MKTLLIVVLAAALAGAAYFTRPSKADFDGYVKAQANATPATASGVARNILNNLTGDAYLNSVVYHDHYLWVTVESNGQSQYLGAFSHWFKRGSTGSSPAPAA